ncbi:hypothetical protein OG497_37835 [Streptomyces sp. NBC_01242]|uniref:hypothetical protein n=1 Tax=Streptomyces sp. NBC_01242 TaxID=2903795 RepID=UPI00224CF31E|nr:hypothetical protein [Streptomyces sp. NBC_01242]MCX4799620.1 hypothetical protein [Streptomyces sp. NBC_01242]
MIAKTAHAATVSRHLTEALTGTGITRGSYGYTVRQITPGTLVEVQWFGDPESNALGTIAAALDARYDVTRTNGYATTSHPVLHIAPGTSLGSVGGDIVTPDDVTHGPYAVAMEGETPNAVYTSTEVLDMITHERADHSEATIDRTTGTMTLHIGKTRAERLTITPATPDQIAAQRAQHQKQADSRTQEAQRHQDAADAWRDTLATAAPERAYHIQTKIRSEETYAADCLTSAQENQAAADALAPQEEPTMPKQTAEDMITLRVPAPTARLWNAATPDLASALDAASRDTAAAWNTAEERPSGRTTVTALTAPGTVLRAFLALLATYAEAEYYADDADTRGADSALKFIARCEATKGLTPYIADDYRMSDPQAQAALDAETAKAQHQAAQQAAQQADNAPHRDAWRALTREEQRERAGTILDAAGTVLGFQRADDRPGLIIGNLMASVPDGRFYMETRSMRHAEESRPALDASREALAAAGWDVTDYGTHFYAQEPQEPAEEQRPVIVRVDWTEKVRGQLRGIMIFALTPAQDKELTNQGREPQFRITRAANKAADGTRRYLVRDMEDTFKVTGTLDHVTRQAASWLGLGAVTLDVQQDDETR